MQKKLRLLILVLVFVLVLGGAYAAYHRLRTDVEVPAPPAAAERSDSFIDFTVYTAEGEPVKLSSLPGKPTLINFWATWCPYCLQEFPEMQSAFDAYGDKVNFAMVDATDGARETFEKAKSFLEENGYTFPGYYDLDTDALNAYGVYNLPTTILLDAKGTIVFRHAGALTYEILEQQILKLLNS